MIFQASRFSASGRRVPLEPRRSEACRSCQPMHVLSFGEGRSVRVFCFPVRVRQPAFGKCEPASWWSLGLNINLVIICFTLRLRGRRGLLFLEWRFDKFFVVLDHFPRSKPQEGYFPIGGVKVKNINLKTSFSFTVLFCWASGLGIGFWLRGVQPRTTMR